ncbi:MAG: hypothetical protein LBT00_07025 [Spirochaetaceae bacterium]|nr:hypothetical protein [Spirochaetaceae bacterium]
MEDQTEGGADAPQAWTYRPECVSGTRGRQLAVGFPPTASYLFPFICYTIPIMAVFKERVDKGYPDKPLLVASQNMGVVPKKVYGSRTGEATKELHLLKLVKTGDFFISLRSFQGGIEYAYYEGIISPAYTVMLRKTDINPQY